VHVDGLAKRYRQVLGELRYCQKRLAHDAARVKRLQQSAASLAAALSICAPDRDVSVLKPLTYRPPVALPGAALVRALLRELRLAATCLSSPALAQAIAATHTLCFGTHSEEATFTARVHRTATALAKRGTVRLAAAGWLV
jgi:hypothetical protein